MTVYLVGGSNTFRKFGWAPAFSAALQERGEAVVNISVGAAANLMGYVRAVGMNDLRAGDVVVWEYALNDEIRIQAGGSMETILRHMEYLLEHCAARGVRVLPMIFVPQHWERRPGRNGVSPYRRHLWQLFRHYQVPYFDVSVRFRAHLGAEAIPDAHFENVQHYAPDSEITGFVAQGALGFLGRAPVPARPGRRWAGAGQQAAYLGAMQGGTPQVLTNERMTLPARGVALQGVSFAPFDRAGSLTALAVVADRAAGYLNLTLGPTSVVFGPSHQERTFSKPTFRLFDFEAALRAPLRFAPGDRLQVASAPQGAQTAYQADRNLPPASVQVRGPSSAWIVGALVEYDA